MLIEDSFTVRTPVDRLWAVLQDVEHVAPCVCLESKLTPASEVAGSGATSETASTSTPPRAVGAPVVAVRAVWATRRFLARLRRDDEP